MLAPAWCMLAGNYQCPGHYALWGSEEAVCGAVHCRGSPQDGDSYRNIILRMMLPRL